MQAFEIDELQRQHLDGGDLYLEFLREPSLSMGLYTLPAGGEDPQQPHDEDEVYYVVAGRALLNVDGEERPVQAGSIVFVPARVPHRFHQIADELILLVFFAPAETK